MADHARATHAIGVADGNGTAVDVEPCRVNTQGLRAIQHLAGKRLVDFPQPDIIDAQAMLTQQLGDRQHRADAHFLWRQAGHSDTTIQTQGLHRAACR
ncbi:hypothetical protein D3C77_335910 [compost metagenome]